MPLKGNSLGLSIMGGAATWSVSAFFLLSGILIAGSIKARSQTCFSLREYAIARFVRIYPPLLLAVLVTVTVVLVIRGLGLYGAETYLMPGDLAVPREKAELTWSGVLTTLTLTYQLIPGHGFMVFNGPLWSLSFEVWLYVLAGLVAAAWFRGSLMAAFGALSVAGMMFVVSTASHPPFWAVGMVWGFGFAFGWLDDTGRRWFARRKWHFLVTALMVCLLIAQSDFAHFLVAPYTGFRQHLVYVFFSFAILCAIISLLHKRETQLGAWVRILAKASWFSYTLYLLHFPLFMLMFALFRPITHPWGLAGAFGLAAFAVVAVVLVSWVTAKGVENRSLIRSLFGGPAARLSAFQRTGMMASSSRKKRGMVANGGRD